MLTVKCFPNGSSVHFVRDGQWYFVNCRKWNGEIIDKIRCDDYRDALAYRRAFCAIARNS